MYILESAVATMIFACDVIAVLQIKISQSRNRGNEPMPREGKRFVGGTPGLGECGEEMRRFTWHLFSLKRVISNTST